MAAADPQLLQLCVSAHYWVQLSYVLATQAGMWTLPLYSSGLQSVPTVTPIFISLLSLLPVSSDLPTFRCFNAWISQTFLCVKQGILCLITAAQLLTPRREIRRTSHNAMMLTSPSTSPFIY